jgi:hypothetical protein
MDGKAEPSTHLHHIPLDGLAEANAGVVALGYDVHEALLDGDLHLDSGVTGAKNWQYGVDHERQCRARDGEPQSADGFAGLGRCDVTCPG